jgi:hypothetical protein
VNGFKLTCPERPEAANVQRSQNLGLSPRTAAVWLCPLHLELGELCNNGVALPVR